MGINTTAELHDIELAAMLMFLLMDIGWLCWLPTIALPTMLLALGFQAYIVGSMRFRGGITLAYQCGLLFWVIGNVLWMWSEFIWAEKKPAGILVYSEDLSSLDRAGYWHYLMAAVCILGWSFVGVSALVYTTIRNQGPREAPLLVYAELYVVPWLFMDAAWAFLDWEIEAKSSSRLMGIWLFVCIVAGMIAVGFCVSSAQRCWTKSYQGEAALCIASCMWVSGNIVWVINDKCFNDENRILFTIALLLFLAGIVATLGGRLRGRKERQPLLGTEQNAISL